MKNKPSLILGLSLLLVISTTACSAESMVLINMKDIVALMLMGVVIVVLGIVFLIEWIRMEIPAKNKRDEK